MPSRLSARLFLAFLSLWAVPAPGLAQASGQGTPPEPGFAARLSGTYRSTIRGYAELELPGPDTVFYSAPVLTVRLRGAKAGLVCDITFMQESLREPTSGDFPVVDANDMLRDVEIEQGAAIALVGCDTPEGYQYFRSLQGDFAVLRATSTTLRAQFDFQARRYGPPDSTLSTHRLRVRGGFYAVPSGGTLSEDAATASDTARG